METIKVKHFMESQNKIYIHPYKPVTFYKVTDEFSINDDKKNEYVCTRVYWQYDRLKLHLIPINEWIKRTTRLKRSQYKKEDAYTFTPIVNVQNIKDKIDEKIWHQLYQKEIKKGKPLTKDENVSIVEEFFNKDIICTLESNWNGYELPICNEKNAYRTSDERMRLFFLVNECKYCKYNKEKRGCVNVVSEHYGAYDPNYKKCNDFCEITN